MKSIRFWTEGKSKKVSKLKKKKKNNLQKAAFLLLWQANLEVFIHSSRVLYSDTGQLLYVTRQTSNGNDYN